MKDLFFFSYGLYFTADKLSQNVFFLVALQFHTHTRIILYVSIEIRKRKKIKQKTCTYGRKKIFFFTDVFVKRVFFFSFFFAITIYSYILKSIIIHPLFNVARLLYTLTTMKTRSKI